MFHFNDLVFISSEQCNLNCKYCYIANTKKDELNYYHQEHNNITQAFKDKSYINNYIEGLRRLNYNLNQIKSVSLWGQEPTINLDSFMENFDYLYENFPNIEQLIFSTNGVNFIEKIYDAAIIIDQIVDKPFKMAIQFSIDGKEYTKINRGIKVEIILNNIKNLISKINNYNFKYINFRFHFHNVVGKNIFTSLNTQEEIDKYWEELNNYGIEMNKYIINQRIDFSTLCMPALENPVQACQEDGIKLYNFIYKSMIGKGRENIECCFSAILNPLEFFFEKNLKIFDLLKIVQNIGLNKVEEESIFHNLSRNCGCNPQSACIKMNYDGKLMYCQNTMFKQRFEDFGEENSDIHFKTLLQKKRYVNLLTDDIKEIDKYFKFYDIYSTQAFGIKLTNTLHLMIWLSKLKLIKPEYEKDQNKLLKHAFMCALLQSCPHNDIIETGSIYGRSIDLIKLYCNGVLDLCEYFILKEEEFYDKQRNRK